MLPKIGEALYTSYAKDHGCDLSAATELACYAGNVLVKSRVLAAVMHEVWASVVIELGEWVICVYDLPEVLNCLQLCERLVMMISLPSMLPWNPPGTRNPA